MNLLHLWHKNLHWPLIIWTTYAFAFKLAWPLFLAGLLLWVVLVFITARGVFWTYIYGSPLVGKGNFEKAEKMLKRAIACKPAIAYPYMTLGIMYARAKRWAEAVPVIRQGVPFASKKHRSDYRTILSIALREIGNYEETLAILDDMVKQGDTSLKIYYNYAMTYLKLDRVDEALAAAQKARAVDTTAVEPVLLLGKINFIRGDYQASKDDYGWATAHLRWPVESFYWIGRSELELGETEHAVEHLQMALERITEDPLLSDVTVDEAKEWLEKAKEKAGKG